MLIPIYQYENTSPDGSTVYGYGPQPPNESWTLDGLAFFGCEASDPGAVPIYLYAFGAENNWELWYSTDANGGDANWHVALTGPWFYALASDDARAVPVYEWTNESPHTHFYGNAALNSLTPPSGGGWSGQSASPWFYAAPAGSQLMYTTQSVTYPKAASSNLKPTPAVVYSSPLKNDSSKGEASQTLSFTKTLDNSYSLSLSDSVTFGGSLEMDIGVPDVAGVKATISMSETTTEGTTWTQSVSEELTMSGTITVPPNSDLVYTCTVMWAKDASVPCTLTVTAEGKGLSADDLTTIFQAANPDFGGQVQTVNPTRIRIIADATFAGTWRTEISGLVTDVVTKEAYSGATPIVLPAPTITINSKGA